MARRPSSPSSQAVLIKVDYWDIHALADAIYSICANESLFQYLKEEGKNEVDQITWEKVGAWIATLYKRTLGWETA